MPSPLPRILSTIFLAGISSGVFWTGLFFLTKDHYTFSTESNLLLAASMGASSALGARGAAPLCRRFAARSVLTAAFGAWASAALLPLQFSDSTRLLWFCALLGAGCSSVVWSILESYVGAGRQGAELRRAIGLFALSWMPATALALLLPVPLLGRLLDSARAPLLAVSAIACLGALALTRGLGSGPVHTPPPLSEVPQHGEYPLLLRSSSLLLPAGYIVSSTLAPVLPARFADVGLPLDGAVGAAIWLSARAATLLWMWRVHGWHGRWETLVVGASALAAGLGLVLLSSSSALLVLGLMLYGAGMGISYYAALYYNLVVGNAEVQSGGKFETVIGLAYAIGPLTGWVAHTLAPPGAANLTTVHLTLLLACLLGPAALRPYLQALAGRQTAR
jgi:hypothetical protein